MKKNTAPIVKEMNMYVSARMAIKARGCRCRAPALNSQQHLSGGGGGGRIIISAPAINNAHYAGIGSIGSEKLRAVRVSES